MSQKSDKSQKEILADAIIEYAIYRLEDVSAVNRPDGSELMGIAELLKSLQLLERDTSLYDTVRNNLEQQLKDVLCAAIAED